MVRRLVGKGIQGASASMAERVVGALLRRWAVGAAGGATWLMGFLGCTFGTHFLYLFLILAQLRKCQVVMGRHATLWLSEACSGMRLGA